VSADALPSAARGASQSGWCRQEEEVVVEQGRVVILGQLTPAAGGSGSDGFALRRLV